MKDNYRYPLFELLSEEHGLILLDSELDEIINKVREIDNNNSDIFKGEFITIVQDNLGYFNVNISDRIHYFTKDVTKIMSLGISLLEREQKINQENE